MTVDAADRPALLAEWLAELAFLAETEGFVADRVETLELEERAAAGDGLRPARAALPTS